MSIGTNDAADRSQQRVTARLQLIASRIGLWWWGLDTQLETDTTPIQMKAPIFRFSMFLLAFSQN